MTSNGKQCLTLEQEAVVKTGLSVDVIMNWVGNHRDCSAEEYKNLSYPHTNNGFFFLLTTVLYINLF